MSPNYRVSSSTRKDVIERKVLRENERLERDLEFFGELVELLKHKLDANTVFLEEVGKDGV